MATEQLVVEYKDVNHAILQDGTILITESVTIAHEGKRLTYERTRGISPTDRVPPSTSGAVKKAAQGINPNRPV